MASVKIVLVKGRSNAQGAFPLVVQVLHDRRKKVVYTSYSVEPSCFDKESRQVLVGGDYEQETVCHINDKCKTISGHLTEAVRRLEEKGGKYTVKDVFGIYATMKERVGFYAYMEGRIHLLIETGHLGMARVYESTLSSIKKYFGEKDFSFESLTHDKIRGYCYALEASGVCKNTINFYLRDMKAVYKRGCHEFGLTLPSPFEGVVIRTEKTVKRSLSVDQLKAVAGLQLAEGTQECLARDVFMFSVNTRGMSFVDVAMLKKKDISDGVIRYKRQKTGQLLEVGVNRQIQALLSRYADTAGDYVFPLVIPSDTNDTYAAYKKAYDRMRYALRKVSGLLGMSTPLQMHSARHSWATLARDNGVSVSIISQCLGHSMEKMTQIYLRDLDRSVLDKANDLVVGCIC